VSRIAGDCKGEFIAARVRKLEHVSGAFGAEIIAMEIAIGLAVELGVVRLTIETDAQLVEQALNRRTPDFSKEACLLYSTL
jgi:hypothetical protein